MSHRTAGLFAAGYVFLAGSLALGIANLAHIGGGTTFAEARGLPSLSLPGTGWPMVTILSPLCVSVGLCLIQLANHIKKQDAKRQLVRTQE